MNFYIPSEIEAISQSAKRFTESEILPNIDSMEASGEFPHKIIEKM